MNKFQVKFPPQETYLSISQSKFNVGEIAVNAVKKKGGNLLGLSFFYESLRNFIGSYWTVSPWLLLMAVGVPPSLEITGFWNIYT